MPASSGATARFLVNGSLMSGEANHQLLAAPGARLIMAEARTELGYELRDLGALPGMVRGGAGPSPANEVDGATLAALDRLESHPRFYRLSRVALENGTVVEAYLLAPEQVLGRPVILSGDRRAHTGEVATGYRGHGSGGEAG